MTSQGPAIDNVCRPAAGEASLRKIALTYRGQERAPTTLADFFPASSSRIDVLIAADADDNLLEAGIAAVAALNSRYPEGTEIELGALADAPTEAVASQRVVVLTAGRPGEVTTDIAAAPGLRRPDPDDRRGGRGPRCRGARTRPHRGWRHPAAGQRPRGRRHQRRARLPRAGPGAHPGRRRRGRGGAVRLRAHRAGREDPPGRVLLPGVGAGGAPPGGAQRRDRPRPGPARRPDERRAGRLQDPRRHRRPRDGLHRLRGQRCGPSTSSSWCSARSRRTACPAPRPARRPSRSTSTPRRPP